MRPFRILVVEDDPDMRETCAKVIRHMGYPVDCVPDAETGLRLLRERPYGVAIVDIRLPGMDGLSLLREIRRVHPDVVPIVITAYASVDSDLEAMQSGAFDYIPKPFTMRQLEMIIERACQYRTLYEQYRALNRQLQERWQIEGIVGRSPLFRQVLQRVHQVAPTDVSVLIRGESGTGKELIARAIHRLSTRADGPFVAVDCGAIPETLLEAEMFGYERGAFTGATVSRKGLIEQAHGGTLFLDEISNLPLAMQAKLLRVLQERTVRRLGGHQEVAVDVRIIAATHEDLAARMRAGTFREDLYYRLNVVEIVLPPLRDRPEDIPLLAEHFFQQLRPRFFKPLEGISRATHLVLRAYRWPGNVRELRNAIEHAMAVSEGPWITPLDLPEHILRAIREVSPTGQLLPYLQARRIALRDFERQYLIRLLTQTRGNVSRAARIAGLRRTSIYKMLRRHGLVPDRFRGG